MWAGIYLSDISKLWLYGTRYFLLLSFNKCSVFHWGESFVKSIFVFYHESNFYLSKIKWNWIYYEMTPFNSVLVRIRTDISVFARDFPSCLSVQLDIDQSG